MSVTDWPYRCLYENSDIMVVHSIANYANGTREAVMAVYLKKMI